MDPPSQLMEYLSRGGPWALFVGALGAIALAAAMERWKELRHARVDVNEIMAKVRKALLVDESVPAAIEACERYRGPLARILRIGLVSYGEAREEIEDGLRANALYEARRLEKRLPFLSTVAVAAPLVGFLGTLLGIADALAPLASQGDLDLALFAGALSRALIPVTAGAAVALPLLVANAYFKSRLRRHATAVELATGYLLRTFDEMERKGIVAKEPK